MKTLEASLTEVNVADLDASFKLGKFEAEVDSDEDGRCFTVTGSATAKVLGGTVCFTVCSNGDVEVDEDAEHGEDFPCDENGDCTGFDAWYARVIDGGLAETVAGYLTARFSSDIDDGIIDAKYDAADSAECSRDPYTYYGVSRRDFY